MCLFTKILLSTYVDLWQKYLSNFVSLSWKLDKPQEGNVNDDDKKENDGENNFKQEGEEENFKITKYELDDEEDQGNFLKGIDNKTVRRYNISIYLLTYLLFSVTHSL